MNRLLCLCHQLRPRVHHRSIPRSGSSCCCVRSGSHGESRDASSAQLLTAASEQNSQPVVLSLTGQFIPGGIQPLRSVLEPQLAPEELHRTPKPFFFKLLIWLTFLHMNDADDFIFLFGRCHIINSSSGIFHVCRRRGNNEKNTKLPGACPTLRAGAESFRETLWILHQLSELTLHPPQRAHTPDAACAVSL